EIGPEADGEEPDGSQGGAEEEAEQQPPAEGAARDGFRLRREAVDQLVGHRPRPPNRAVSALMPRWMLTLAAVSVMPVSAAASAIEAPSMRTRRMSSRGRSGMVPSAVSTSSRAEISGSSPRANSAS